MSQKSVSLGKLRQMRDAVARYAATVEPFADGSWDNGAGGWSDKDEAHRSLTEAWIYLDGWVRHRERHGVDPVRGGAGRA